MSRREVSHYRTYGSLSLEAIDTLSVLRNRVGVVREKTEAQRVLSMNDNIIVALLVSE